MKTFEDPLALEEAVSALREELLKDLVESVPIGQSFNETVKDHQDLI